TRHRVDAGHREGAIGSGPDGLALDGAAQKARRLDGGKARAVGQGGLGYWAALRARRGPREPATRGGLSVRLSVAGDRERSMAKQIGQYQPVTSWRGASARWPGEAGRSARTCPPRRRRCTRSARRAG